MSAQELVQGWVDGDEPSSAGFAVLGEYADGSLLQVDVFVAQAGDFVRAYAGIEHHADGGQAYSAAIFLRGA